MSRSRSKSKKDVPGVYNPIAGEDEQFGRRKVSSKLQESFASMLDEEVMEGYADCLSCWASIKEKYLAGLLDPVTDILSAKGSIQTLRNLEYQQEVEEETNGAQAASSRVHVSLFLYESRDIKLKERVSEAFAPYMMPPSSSHAEFSYGPFHAAIQIGDIVLDWDESSLVIPRRVTASLDTLWEKPTSLIFHDTLQRMRMGDVVPRVVYALKPGVEEADFGTQVNIVADLSAENKDTLINQLAALIEKYNTKYYYGLFSCNCQKFVKEVLQVMGISKHTETFHDQQRMHEQVLLKRGKDQILEFNTHTMVDDYVRKYKDIMSKEDAEFCMCHYLLFHCWGKKHPSREAWKCDPSTCQAEFCKVSAKLK